MKIDKVLRGKRKYPKIICENKELLSDIGCFLGVRNRIKEEFGKLLLNLGFSVNDEIVLCKYDRKTFTFTYIVNGRNPYKKNIISLDLGLMDDEPKVLISTGSRKTRTVFVYKGSRNKENKIDDNFRMMYSDRKLQNGVCCRRTYYNNYFKIELLYPGNYELVIILNRPFNDTCINKSYELVREDKLIDYLVSLDMPIDVLKLYDNIRDICNEFNNFLTKIIISCKDLNNNIYNEMEIYYGELVKVDRIEDRSNLIIDDVSSFGRVRDVDCYVRNRKK